MPRKKIQDPNDPQAIIARLMMEDQAEKLDEKNRKKRSRDMALEQMQSSEKEKQARDARLQAICDHLLGNHKIGVKPRYPRSALHYDQLSNAAVRIYCQKCRFEWCPGDQDEFIFRRHPEGHWVKSVNPTRTSWLKMREFFFTFDNANDLISRAFRMEKMEPEDPILEEARLLAAAGNHPGA